MIITNNCSIKKNYWYLIIDLRGQNSTLTCYATHLELPVRATERSILTRYCAAYDVKKLIKMMVLLSQGCTVGGGFPTP